MLGFFRKWAIALKRRRLRKERALLLKYKTIEENASQDAARCHNCKAPLTGPFCHICGQRDDDLRRPIWTFFRELMDAIFDTDSKIIKTILLLVLVPGGLSRAFMEGRRARFLPPFRLYVVLLFVFFSTLSLADVLILDVHVQPKAERIAAREAAQAEREAKMETSSTPEEAVFNEDEQQHVADEEGLTQKIEESAAEFEQERVEGAGIKSDEITEQRKETTSEVLPSESPVPPQTPTLIEAIESVDKGDAAGSTILTGLLANLAKQSALNDGENDGDTGENIRTAQERVRQLLDEPGRKFSPEQRAALQSVLAMDAEQIAEDARNGRGFGLFSDDLPYDFDLAMFVPNTNEVREGIKQEDIDYVLNDPTVPDLVKKASEGLAEALQNPREFNKLFNDWLPLAMVVLLPFFAFILRVFHWGKRRYYLNQLVFALHFHSFLFVMLTSFAFIVPVIGGESAFEYFWWITSLYLIIALKVGQNQGWFRAFFKAGFIWASYFSIMMLTMSLVMFLGLSDSGIGDFYDMIQNGAAMVNGTN